MVRQCLCSALVVVPFILNGCSDSSSSDSSEAKCDEKSAEYNATTCCYADSGNLTNAEACCVAMLEGVELSQDKIPETTLELWHKYHQGKGCLGPPGVNEETSCMVPYGMKTRGSWKHVVHFQSGMTFVATQGKTKTRGKEKGKSQDQQSEIAASISAGMETSFEAGTMLASGDVSASVEVSAQHARTWSTSESEMVSSAVESSQEETVSFENKRAGLHLWQFVIDTGRCQHTTQHFELTMARDVQPQCLPTYCDRTAYPDEECCSCTDSTKELPTLKKCPPLSCKLGTEVEIPLGEIVHTYTTNIELFPGETFQIPCSEISHEDANGNFTLRCESDGHIRPDRSECNNININAGARSLALETSSRYCPPYEGRDDAAFALELSAARERQKDNDWRSGCHPPAMSDHILEACESNTTCCNAFCEVHSICNESLWQMKTSCPILIATCKDTWKSNCPAYWASYPEATATVVQVIDYDDDDDDDDLCAENKSMSTYSWLGGRLTVGYCTSGFKCFRGDECCQKKGPLTFACASREGNLSSNKLCAQYFNDNQTTPCDTDGTEGNARTSLAIAVAIFTALLVW